MPASRNVTREILFEQIDEQIDDHSTVREGLLQAIRDQLHAEDKLQFHDNYADVIENLSLSLMEIALRSRAHADLQDFRASIARHLRALP